MPQTELQDAFQTLAIAFDEFDTLLRKQNKSLWEQWKAGGKAVTDEFLSMYPSAQEIAENNNEDEEDEEEE